MRVWPLSGVTAVVLILARAFVDTPNLPEDLQKNPSAETVEYIDERVVDLLIGMGLSFLGLAFVVVFFAGLARSAHRTAPDSLAGPLITLGGATTAAATFVGYAMLALLAGAADEDRAPTTVAAIYTITDSLAYIGWTPLGLVTAGVAIAGLRDGAVPRWLGWFSAVATILFVLLAFVPFLSWAPALVWLLVASIGMALALRRPQPAS